MAKKTTMTSTQTLEQARALIQPLDAFHYSATERKIAAALMRAWADGLQSGTRYMSAYWANQAIEIASKMRAEADALDRNNK